MDANWVKKSERAYGLLHYTLIKPTFLENQDWVLTTPNAGVLNLMEHSRKSEKPPLEDAAYAIQDHLLGLKREIELKVSMVGLVLETLKKGVT